MPDVALAADPNTGALVVFDGQETGIGGTSWSAPVWAGFCALINDSRAKANKAPLAYVNPRLYQIRSTNPSCFRDIVSGTNGAFSAGPGHDQVTGLGVPNMRELTKELTK